MYRTMDTTNTLPPEPQVTEQARLIVVAVGYWLIICLIVAAVLSVRAYVTYTPPPPPKPCVVTPTRSCTAETISGPYTLYYVAWNKSVGIASPTPQPNGAP